MAISAARCEHRLLLYHDVAGAPAASRRSHHERQPIDMGIEMGLDNEIYDPGDVRLQRGATLRGCKLAYKTFGTLNPKKDSVIVCPTWYSGQHEDNERLIGEGRALDPKKDFTFIPNTLGNGLSASPSNTPEPYDGPRSPDVTACDNVRVQHRLVTERFGIEHIRLIAARDPGGCV